MDTIYSQYFNSLAPISFEMMMFSESMIYLITPLTSLPTFCTHVFRYFRYDIVCSTYAPMKDMMDVIQNAAKKMMETTARKNKM